MGAPKFGLPPEVRSRRRSWIGWLYAVRKRFGLSVLNYQVASNQVHLLIRDRYVDDVDGLSILHDGAVPCWPRFGGEIVALRAKSTLDFAES